MRRFVLVNLSTVLVLVLIDRRFDIYVQLFWVALSSQTDIGVHLGTLQPYQLQSTLSEQYWHRFDSELSLAVV